MKKSYLCLIALSVFLMSLDRVFNLDFVRSGSRVVLSPLNYGLYNLGLTTKQGVKFFVELPLVYSENQKLKSEIADLSEEVINLQKLKEENIALRFQLGVKGEIAVGKISASLLGFHEQKNSIVFLINKGESDGIKENLIVVTGEQLVGKVIQVSAKHSYVLPIFAVDSRVPAKILSRETSNGEGQIKGLVKGQFNQRILLTEILQDANLQIGDVVVTSGKGGVYPSDLILGKIQSIDAQDNEVFQTATLKPLRDLDNLRTIFVYE